MKAVGTLLDAMRQFPKDARWQQWCCGALYSLVRGNSENLNACTSQGGVETVLRAMKLDKTNAALVARADELINVLWEF